MKASEIHSKKSAERKSLAIDCINALFGSETIDTIEAATIHGSAGTLTLSGIEVIAEKVIESGQRTIHPGEGIKLFAAGGTAGVTYEIELPFNTTGGQRIIAEIELVVLP